MTNLSKEERVSRLRLRLTISCATHFLLFKMFFVLRIDMPCSYPFARLESFVRVIVPGPRVPKKEREFIAELRQKSQVLLPSCEQLVCMY
jgi:hypothetical protein